ncbi:hypothetical protein PAAL109150_09485 [Paenibacillus alkaliterrae]
MCGITVKIQHSAHIGKFSKGMEKEFGSYRLPQWFRFATGLVELKTGILLAAGSWQDSFAAVTWMPFWVDICLKLFKGGIGYKHSIAHAPSYSKDVDPQEGESRCRFAFLA